LLFNVMLYENNGISVMATNWSSQTIIKILNEARVS
jgi:hypothetical protein